MNRESILEEAIKITTQERVGVHGNPEDSFRLIASVWNWYLGDVIEKPIEGWQVAVMMTLFKVARSMNTPEHMDNFIDAIGYLAIAAELYSKKDQGESIANAIQDLIDFVVTPASEPPAGRPLDDSIELSFPDDFLA